MKRASTIALLFSCTLLAAGCDSGGSNASADDDDDERDQDAAAGKSDAASRSDASVRDAAAADATSAPDDAATGDPKVQVGHFTLRLNAAVENNPAYVSLTGKISDGPTPSELVWDKEDTSESCTLYVPRSPFCETSCGAGVCVEDDVCQSNPSARAAGKATFTGVQTSKGETSFASDPINGSYQLPAGLSLPFPPFAEGDEVEVSTAGGKDIAPFTIAAKGIAPLTLSGSANGYPLERGKPLALSWNAAKDASSSRIHVKLDISHHGGFKGKVECDVPDDGALSIPSSLIDQLLALGVAGYPTVIVTRSSVGSATVAFGRVDLNLTMYVEAPILIDGLVSCNGDEACPSGKTCQKDKTCK